MLRKSKFNHAYIGHVQIFKTVLINLNYRKNDFVFLNKVNGKIEILFINFGKRTSLLDIPK